MPQFKKHMLKKKPKKFVPKKKIQVRAKKERKHEIPKWKLEKISELKEIIPKYQTIALVNLETLPTKQLQLVKKKLRNNSETAVSEECQNRPEGQSFKPSRFCHKIQLVITKKIIIKKVLDEISPEARKLSDKIEGTPALLLANLGAFELFKILKENRQLMAAKPGQLAPEDIWVQAGPTPFAPGPVISELAQLKLKTGVVAGKIEIKEDACVVKKGNAISPLAASILGRLGITPVQVGVKLVSALEGKEIYDAAVLDINTEVFIENLKLAAVDALKLAIERGIITAETACILLGKAYRDARTLAIAKDIMNPDTTAEILAKIQNQAQAIKGLVKD